MKSFSTLRDTQRGSQMEHEEIHRLHGEEKREGGVRGDWNEMRWDQKRREQASSNHFLMYAPLSGPLRDIHGVIQRRGEGGRRQRWPGG